MSRLRMLGPRVSTIDLRRVATPEKHADDIYSGPEYEAWREIVVARAGRRCEASDRGERCRKAEPQHRMFADHIVEVKDGGALHDPANGQCLCGSHHQRKGAAARGERQSSGGASSHPDWLMPSAIPLRIVCGAPAAGKTTFVRQRSLSSHLVIDLDEIRKQLAPSFPAPDDLLRAAIRRRNVLLGAISRRSHWSGAWLIVMEPQALWRQWWWERARPTEIVVLRTPAIECMRRIDQDPARASVRTSQKDAIAKWWAEYTPRLSEVAIDWKPTG